MTASAQNDSKTQVTAAWLSDQIEDATAAGIAATVTRLMRLGSIEPGTQLPTVRALAKRLGVSPGTVSAAWSALKRQRVVEGGGRRGIHVLERPIHLAPQRFENVSRFWQGDILDLTLAVPDPSLLPNAIEAITKATKDPQLNSYRRTSITDELQATIEPIWPWKSDNWMAVNGGYEGLLLLAASNFIPGQPVAVADPTTPRIMDILDLTGAQILPVESDGSGPLPEPLAHALSKDPVAFIYEPRAGSRSGTSLTPERRNQLAEVLSGSPTLIIEDDGLGDLASATYSGLGAVFPSQSVLVRSYSKSHGPDLRIAIMGGSAEAIERARVYRQFGAGWTSRIMQNALAWMLVDPDVQAMVETARTTYAARRHEMAQLLSDRGVPVENNDGLSLWVPVLNEQQALLVLASHGVAAGSVGSGAVTSGRRHIRLPVGRQLDDPERIADLYAMASVAI